jgi:hypothetical protein
MLAVAEHQTKTIVDQKALVDKAVADLVDLQTVQQVQADPPTLAVAAVDVMDLAVLVLLLFVTPILWLT